MSFNFFKYQRRFCSSLHNYRSIDNPRVFLEFSKDGKSLGKMVFELYSNHCPKTAANFKALCTGDNPKKLTYKKNVLHRIISEFMAQGGDLTNTDGLGGESIYGRTFKDENLQLEHFKRGVLSMANSGPDSNGSQFFITFQETPWLNGYHCVFGEMIEGDEVLDKIEECGSEQGKPRAQIKIVGCGEVKI